MKCKIIILFLTFFSIQLEAKNSITTDSTRVVNKSEIYSVTQDANSIFFTMSSNDPQTMMSMLRRGVIVYFDVKGKKKHNISVTYPFIDEKSKQGIDEGKKLELRSLQDEKGFNARIVGMLDKKIFQNARYVYNGDNLDFNVLMNNHQIAAVFDFKQEEGILTYTLNIPKLKINEDPSTDFSKLTIGVKSPERAVSNRPEGNKNVQSNRRGSGQARGRGGASGGGQRGQNGGQIKQGAGAKKEGSKNSILNFWFETNLN